MGNKNQEGNRINAALPKTMFFSLFFEVEPFAAILIAHRTHGHRQKFVLGHREIQG